MNHDAMPDWIAEVDDPAVRSILIYSWLTPDIGEDTVLTLVSLITGLGETEDDVRRDVAQMRTEIECGELWLTDPEQALWDYVGRNEPHGLTAYAGQFAAEAFDRARAIAARLASAHSLLLPRLSRAGAL